MSIEKKDLFYSLFFGFIASWFLIFIINNPYIEEFKQLTFLKDIVFWLPLILPTLFLSIILFASFLSRYFKTIYQFGKFAEVGLLNTFIDFGILNFLISLTGITGGIAIAPLNVISFFCTNINSYFWNKSWTFKKKGVFISKELTQFIAISAVGLLINTGIVVITTTFITAPSEFSSGAWVNLMKIVATIASMTWNFLGYKILVFKS